MSSIKTISVLVVLLTIVVTGYACDPCSFYQYNTLQQKSYVAFFYRLRQFNGYDGQFAPAWRWQPADYRNARISHEVADGPNVFWTPSKRDFMRLESYELRYNHSWDIKLSDSEDNSPLVLNLTGQLGWGRSSYYLADIVKYDGMRPNQKQDSLVQTLGIQDPRLGLSAYYSLYTGDLKHNIGLGFLIRLPLGAFNVLEPNGRLIHPELQQGTGALDLMPRLNYMLIYESVGADFNGIYRFSGTNSNGYQFGPGYNLQADFFYTAKISPSFKIVPRAGVYHEFERVHFQDRLAVNGTGGQATFGNIQLDLMYRETALTLQYQHPFSSQLNGRQLLNAGRLNLGLVVAW